MFMSILFISIILVKFIFSFFVIEELISLQHFLRYCSILVCVSEWGIHRLLVRDGSWTNDLLARRQWSFNVMFKEVLSTLNICQLHVDSNPQRWAVTWSTQTWPADGRTMSCNVFFFFFFLQIVTILCSSPAGNIFKFSFLRLHHIPVY